MHATYAHCRLMNPPPPFYVPFLKNDYKIMEEKKNICRNATDNGFLKTFHGLEPNCIVRHIIT